MALAQLNFTRQFAILALAFTAAHVGVNVLAVEVQTTLCPYDRWYGLLPTAVVLGTYGTAMWTRVHEFPRAQAFEWAADVIGIVPGIWWQITTKPDGWFASVPVEHCSLRDSGYAMALWLLGELLTFGAAVNIAAAVNFGRNQLNTVVVVLAAVALLFASGMVAQELQSSF